MSAGRCAGGRLTVVLLLFLSNDLNSLSDICDGLGLPNIGKLKLDFKKLDAVEAAWIRMTEAPNWSTKSEEEKSRERAALEWKASQAMAVSMWELRTREGSKAVLSDRQTSDQTPGISLLAYAALSTQPPASSDSGYVTDGASSLDDTRNLGDTLSTLPMTRSFHLACYRDSATVPENWLDASSRGSEGQNAAGNPNHVLPPNPEAPPPKRRRTTPNHASGLDHAVERVAQAATAVPDRRDNAFTQIVDNRSSADTQLPPSEDIGAATSQFGPPGNPPNTARLAEPGELAALTHDVTVTDNGNHTHAVTTATSNTPSADTQQPVPSSSGRNYEPIENRHHCGQIQPPPSLNESYGGNTSMDDSNMQFEDGMFSDLTADDILRSWRPEDVDFESLY